MEKERGGRTSTGIEPSLLNRARYVARVGRMLGRESPVNRAKVLIQQAEADAALYASVLQRYSNLTIDQAKVLEIGFGRLPLRTAVLSRRCESIISYDLDWPLLGFSVSGARQVASSMGIEAFAKALVKYAVYDRHVWKLRPDLLHSLLAIQRRGELRVEDATRMRVCDSSMDLVVSEDVFEHIDRSRMGELLDRLGKAVSPRGVLLIRPHIWTGISGAHLPGWYPGEVARGVSSPKEAAWSHLRGVEPRVDTYLNRLRLDDYRDLFSNHFRILEEVRAPSFSKGYMTSSIRKELGAYTDEELLYDKVLFVLAPDNGA